MSLRSRLLIVITVAMLPAIGLAYLDALEAQNSRRQQVRANVSALAESKAATFREVFTGAHELLAGLAAQPAVTQLRESACTAILEQVAASHPGNTGFAVADAAGHPHCRTTGKASTNLGGTDWFKAARKTRGFTVGDVQVGGLSHRLVIVPAHAVFAGGAFAGVIATGLPTEEIQKISAATKLPSGYVLLVLNRAGIVLARVPPRPDMIGEFHPSARLRAAATGEQIDDQDVDGKTYVWSIGAALPLRLVVGAPKSSLDAPATRQLLRSVILILLAVAVGVAIVWTGTRLLLDKPIATLIKAAEEFARGDLNPRAGLSKLSGELGRLGRAFTDMGFALQMHRDAERKAQTKLRQLNLELAAKIEQRTETLSQMNIELEQARKAADQANLAKTMLLRRVSHELRTPLNAMLGFSQLLELDESDPERRDSHARIQRAGHHLVELIDEMLDIARVESGAIELSIENVPVEEVIAEALELTAALAEPAGVELARSTTWLVARADRQRLRQVVVNLLGNAVKYTEVGGRIEIRTTAAGDHVRIEVEDTGIGISPTELDDLFTPFHRLPQGAERARGSGLGLALCKTLVEAMDGTIGVESTPGAGSTFWVELPAAP